MCMSMIFCKCVILEVTNRVCQKKVFLSHISEQFHIPHCIAARLSFSRQVFSEIKRKQTKTPQTMTTTTSFKFTSAVILLVTLTQRIKSQSTQADANDQQSPFGLTINAPSNDRGGGALVDLKLPFLRVLAGGFGERDPNNPNSLRRGGGGADVSIGNLLRVIGFGDGARGGGGGGGADVRLGTPNNNGGNLNFPILSSILAGLGRPGGISVSPGRNGNPVIGVNPQNLKPEPVENLTGGSSDAEIISPRTDAASSSTSRFARGSVDPLGIGAAFQRFVAGPQN